MKIRKKNPETYDSRKIKIEDRIFHGESWVSIRSFFFSFFSFLLLFLLSPTSGFVIQTMLEKVRDEKKKIKKEKKNNMGFYRPRREEREGWSKGERRG
jgi:hypothetical protein